eukprot:CAMPEP_0195123672 /NCGR_PEP_ID=MMETSP0448-20130528/129144_1 /TAXON_ID=66468 /ORGANISM="Heterocapsa triquestra, Strain CCMP 448" /LENGTH=49 /DNA_ID= /DNA_START= /DNA_END= /DNA_ORIENTATION=
MAIGDSCAIAVAYAEAIFPCLSVWCVASMMWNPELMQSLMNSAMQTADV